MTDRLYLARVQTGADLPAAPREADRGRRVLSGDGASAVSEDRIAILAWGASLPLLFEEAVGSLGSVLGLPALSTGDQEPGAGPGARSGSEMGAASRMTLEAEGHGREDLLAQSLRAVLERIVANRVAVVRAGCERIGPVVRRSSMIEEPDDWIVRFALDVAPLPPTLADHLLSSTTSIPTIDPHEIEIRSRQGLPGLHAHFAFHRP